ncbi:MAG: hypothetical protein KBD10_02300 [Candidatus Pacebacteria bacterium]|jgi:hypothetical protein|nr:hypothetical protein [Candidatus Paceibacterota bacterium]
MNDLNAQQIVLLCLLVSFVSSVATGITTVSLLDQAPKPVSQTINRVVERTIERVVDPVVATVTNVATNNSKPIERIVETVVVNQEDLTVEAVEKNAKSLVRLYGVNRVNEKFFIGLGVVVSADGTILTSSTVPELSQKFYAEYVNGTFEIALSKVPNKGAVLFAPKNVTEGTTFTAATFGNSQNIKLAQSVIVLGGQDSNLVSTGIVTGLESAQGTITNEDLSANTQPISTINQINTSISADTIIRGSILMTLKGEIVGVRIMGAGASSFVSSNSIKTSIGI